jgi:hypothetical protein
LGESKAKLDKAKQEHDMTKAALETEIPFLNSCIQSISYSLNVAAALCRLIALVFQIQEDMA